MQLVNKVC